MPTWTYSPEPPAWAPKAIKSAAKKGELEMFKTDEPLDDGGTAGFYSPGGSDPSTSVDTIVTNSSPENSPAVMAHEFAHLSDKLGSGLDGKGFAKATFDGEEINSLDISGALRRKKRYDDSSKTSDVLNSILRKLRLTGRKAPALTEEIKRYEGDVGGTYGGKTLDRAREQKAILATGSLFVADQNRSGGTPSAPMWAEFPESRPYAEMAVDLDESRKFYDEYTEWANRKSE